MEFSHVLVAAETHAIVLRSKSSVKSAYCCATKNRQSWPDIQVLLHFRLGTIGAS